MATLTIRDLDDALKQSLRVRAAHRNRSMEEEARQILRAALQSAPTPSTDLAQRIRSRFNGLGDVHLPQAVREAVRPPPAFDEPVARVKVARRPAAKSAPKSAAAARRTRR